MLYEFLIDNREKLLALVREKTVGISESRPTSERSEQGLPEFFEYLIDELKRESEGLPKKHPDWANTRKTTSMHGEELSRLGYTVSQVVHGYGVLCQAITELSVAAHTPISALEFSALNYSLDVAIADAVTGFTEQKDVENVNSNKEIGFLVHELRNSLAAAIIAQSMIKKGVVGTGGSTNALLERNLNRMRELLDRSFSEVRMKNEKTVDLRPVFLIKIVEEVEATASEQAHLRGLTLRAETDPRTQVNVDSNYMVSALANIVQNAIKYSKKSGTIWIRTRDADGDVQLEVEDACGGLPKGKADELFRPFIQKGADRTGLGLGLTISRRAIALNGGTLTVRDLPGKGCIFTITLPKHAGSLHSTNMLQ
jgi:hypothetical protein